MRNCSPTFRGEFLPLRRKNLDPLSPAFTGATRCAGEKTLKRINRMYLVIIIKERSSRRIHFIRRIFIHLTSTSHVLRVTSYIYIYMAPLTTCPTKVFFGRSRNSRFSLLTSFSSPPRLISSRYHIRALSAFHSSLPARSPLPLSLLLTPLPSANDVVNHYLF